METLRQKARVLSLAWLHQIADAAVDTHSIPVVQQHIRDLEQAISDLREAQAENAGAIAGLYRQISQLHQQEATLNTQADALLQLNPPREDLAATVEQRLQDVESRLMSLMLVYSKKWEQLRRNRIRLRMSWPNLPCSSGLLLAKHVLVFLPPEVQPSLNCRSNSLLLADVLISDAGVVMSTSGI